MGCGLDHGARGGGFKNGAAHKDALLPPKGQMAWRPAPDLSLESGITEKRRAVLEVLQDSPPMTTSDAALLTGVSKAMITAMAKDGLLEAVTINPEDQDANPILGKAHQTPSLTLTSAQDKAAHAVKQALDEGCFTPFVLDGVTGSGKTEVYFEAITHTIAQGRQALILLPEIALSPAMQKRFKARFGDWPVVWHSGLTPHQRNRAYRRIAKGQAPVVIGARSALFLPYPNLGLITVDEEHDQSYKQDDHVPYQARDMAVMRAKAEDIPVILATASPSLKPKSILIKGGINVWN